MKTLHILLLATLFSASEVFAVDLKATLTPSPVSIALTVGQWLMKEEKKAYYVQVEATADSKESARNEAFRLAVEMAVGTIVVAETEIKNTEILRKDFLKYSSGYIDNFSIKSESIVGDKIRLVVDVWVGESKIADRILNVSKADGVIDGDRIAVQQKSIKLEKDNASRLIEIVAKDFPMKSFDVKVGKSQSYVDGRKTVIDIPVFIRWNSKYLDSLIEILDRTKDGDGSSESNYKKHRFIVSYRKERGWLTYHASYKDTKPGIILLSNFIESKPVLRINFNDETNSPIAFNCRSLRSMSGNYFSDAKMIVGTHSLDQATGQFFASNTPNAHFGIFGDFEGESKIRSVFEENADLIARMRKIEVSVVRKEECDVDDGSLASRPDVLVWCRSNLGNGKKFCPPETREMKN